MARGRNKRRALASLAVSWGGWSCGEAAYCTAEQVCPPRYDDYEALSKAQTPDDLTDGNSDDPSPVESGYAAVIEAVCENVCVRLDECSLVVFAGESVSCDEACVSLTEQEGYWTCEPLYRALIDCYSTMVECDASVCESITSSYISCRDTHAPVTAADSCILAFNGECDEPDRCLAGSDSTDCSTR